MKKTLTIQVPLQVTCEVSLQSGQLVFGEQVYSKAPDNKTLQQMFTEAAHSRPDQDNTNLTLSAVWWRELVQEVAKDTDGCHIKRRGDSRYLCDKTPQPGEISAENVNALMTVFHGHEGVCPACDFKLNQLVRDINMDKIQQVGREFD